MKKSYLFVFNHQVGTRDEIKEILNKMSTVETWRYDMPNCFYLVSESVADNIVSEFERLCGAKGRFIFMEYNENSQGRLTEESWFLLNEKKHQKKNVNETSD